MLVVVVVLRLAKREGATCRHWVITLVRTHARLLPHLSRSTIGPVDVFGNPVWVPCYSTGSETSRADSYNRERVPARKICHVAEMGLCLVCDGTGRKLVLSMMNYKLL